MSRELKDALKSKQRPSVKARRHMVHVLVESMRQHHPNPTLSEFKIEYISSIHQLQNVMIMFVLYFTAQVKQVASRVVKAHPDSLQDRTERGTLLGTGFHSLAKQMTDRIGYTNRGNDAVRIRHRRRRLLASSDCSVVLTTEVR